MMRREINEMGFEAMTGVSTGEDNRDMVKLVKLGVEGNIGIFALTDKDGVGAVDILKTKEEVIARVELVNTVTWMTQEQKSEAIKFLEEMSELDVTPLIKTYKRFVNDYGFEKIEVRPLDGGKLSITNFLNKDSKPNSDIGMFTLTNKHGVGFTDYIRNIKDIAFRLKSLKDIEWLNDEERTACFEFLGNMEHGATILLAKSTTEQENIESFVDSCNIENRVKELGFKDEQEFHSCVASLTLDTEMKTRLFREWQFHDGTKDGFLKLKELIS